MDRQRSNRPASPETGLTFDRANHAYAFNGRPLISVTQAIKAAGLIDLQWSTQAARDRGCAVHMAVHFDAEGDLDESSVDPVVWPYLAAARKFKSDVGADFGGATEMRVCAPHLGCAGTLDFMFVMNDARGTRCMVDFKTTGVRDWVRLQLVAYSTMLTAAHGTLRYGVQLKPDGTYKVRCFGAETYRRDLNDFMSCLRVAQMQREAGCPPQ